ncbi:PREDICTED: venom prothrombin activator omicarin-C non-catalytic subunit-like [Branchiostoma belcheri]|uniref:Venom prothrombin activator omicarin-C non-catalytic subunit-like n=1 Tax=Branchiostoma belcheri TaxID=7741 RepID=A0A6P4ZNV6_BRABE|nr:PREDICTED: venom prothrombin activator omicarin-C non-catalytic subunit-like [Branchiostoma belcheri]
MAGCDVWWLSYNVFVVAFLASGHTIVEAQAPDGCTFALGMSSGYIQNEQLTASGWNTTWHYQPWGARLNGGRAWQTNTTDPSPWLQVRWPPITLVTGDVTTYHHGYMGVDLRPPVIPRHITSLQTQGLWQGWVSSYTVEISNDTTDWLPYENGKVSMFMTIITYGDGEFILYSVYRNRSFDRKMHT